MSAHDPGLQPVQVSMEMTSAQAEVLKNHADLPYRVDADGVLVMVEIRDDSFVAEHTVQPDGTFRSDSLEEGFHYGWTRFDDEGYELDRDTNERVSDVPNPDWA